MSEAKRYKLFQDVCYDDGAFVIPAGQVMVREADYNALLDERDRLRSALERISTEHCAYKTDCNSQYDIGVVDGHRCAATIAKAALTPAGGGAHE